MKGEQGPFFLGNMDMDRNWQALVKEGREVAGRKDRDLWYLGKLADAAETGYGKKGLERYAEEIGHNFASLRHCRATFRAWKDEKVRPRTFSVGQDLACHPDRGAIVRSNPNIASYEARAEMKKWRDANRPPKLPKPEAPLPEREAEIQKGIEDFVEKMKPHLEDAQRVKAGRKGLVSKEEALIISRCLHPDNSASPETRNKAFIIWNRIQHLLMSEDDAPTVIVFPLRRKTA
jgi:hypothetical protein